MAETTRVRMARHPDASPHWTLVWPETATDAEMEARGWEFGIFELVDPAPPAPVEAGDGEARGSNEQRRAEEDALIPMIMRRDDYDPGDRLTPRMAARRLIDRLDHVRRAPAEGDGEREATP
jgi:hypothetical protein